MPRKLDAYIEEILEAIKSIKSFVRGMTLNKYIKDDKTKAAVERKLLNIGEALNQMNGICHGIDGKIADFKKIIGFRNILVHGYFGIDDALVWDVISNKLGQLEKDLKNPNWLPLLNQKKPSHPWRLCPEGQYWRSEHIQPTYTRADGTIVHKHRVRAGCCENPSKKDQIYSAELQRIAKKYFSKLVGAPAANSLKFDNGNSFDVPIRGRTRFWNEVLEPPTPLDPNFVKALIATESGFHPNIIIKDSPRNGCARGLMQVTDLALRTLGDVKGELKDHFLHIGQKEIIDPNLNIAAGVRWLFNKRRLASSKLGREASWEETVADYKGILNKLLKDPKHPPKPIGDLRDYYRRLIEQ